MTAFSIWTIHRWNPAIVEEALLRRGVSLKALRAFSGRVARLRGQVFAHNDIATLGNQDEVYRASNLTGREIDTVAAALSRAIQDIYPKLVGEAPLPQSELPGGAFDEIYARVVAPTSGGIYGPTP